MQLDNSDVLTFHNYGLPEGFRTVISQLKQYGRPVLCSEYMARDVGSLIDLILPIAHSQNVMAIKWGLVTGKSQMTITRDSWQHPYAKASDYAGLDATDYQVVLLPSGNPPPAGGGTKVQPYASETPPIRHHDLFQTDGMPYRTVETDLIYKLSTSGRK